MKASWKRRVLALYLDFLWVSALVHVVTVHFGFYDYRFPLSLLLLLLVEVLLYQFEWPSLGDYLLGIHSGEDGPVVDVELRSAAHWFILLCGTLQFLEAAKFFSSGNTEYPFYYFLGRRLEGFWKHVVVTLLSLLTAWSAIALFRCKKFAPTLVVVWAALSIGNDAASLPLLREFVDWRMLQRSIARGRTIPVSGETIILLSFAVYAANAAVWLILNRVMRNRFRYDGLV